MSAAAQRLVDADEKADAGGVYKRDVFAVDLNIAIECGREPTECWSRGDVDLTGHRDSVGFGSRDVLRVGFGVESVEEPFDVRDVADGHDADDATVVDDRDRAPRRVLGSIAAMCATESEG